MKTFSFYFLLVFVSFQGFSQEMIKMDIVALTNKVAAPPTDVKAAYLRLECTEVNMSRQCSAEKFYKPTADEIADIQQRLEQLAMALAMPAPSAMQNMNPEDIEKKMASMTPEEQMQFAMQMNAQMGFGPKSFQPESDEVVAALEAYSELTAQISMEVQDSDGILQKRTMLDNENQAKHREIDDWYAAEYQKLPRVIFGVTSGEPEPKAEYALRVAALERHIADENEYLQTLQVFWQEYLAHFKTQYTPFQEKLAAINYGEDAVNIENKRILVSGQGQLLTPGERLLEFSRETTDTAAKWWLQKLDLENQKPL